MPIFRVLTLVVLLLFAAAMMNACPAGTDEGGEDTYGSQGQPTDAPEGAGVEGASGEGDAPISTRGASEGETGEEGEAGEGGEGDAGEGDEGTEGSTYIMKQAEIMAIDMNSGLIDVQLIEGDTPVKQTFTLADGFPKCPDCGMEMEIKAGDKGEYDFATAQDGTLKFVGVHCEDRAKCAAGDKSACENCPAHKKKDAAPSAA